MATIETNRCYICKKLFCCVDCCSNHIKNKHCKSECTCPLCRGEPLIIRNFQHQPFLSHVIFNHLPLYCRTCGRLFRNYEDLKNLNACIQCPLINIEPPTYTPIETSTSDLGLPSAPKTPSDLAILKKSFSWTDSYSNSIKNSPPTSTRYTSTPMHIGFLKQKFSALIKSPNILLTTPQNLVKSSVISDKQKKLTNKQNTNQNKEESVHFNLSIVKSSPDRTPLRSILSLKSSHNNTNQDNLDHSITEKKSESMQDSHKSPPIKNDHSSSLENNSSDQEASYSTKRRLRSGKENKDSGKKVRFSDQFDNMSIISEYEDVHSKIIDTTGGEEFFESCQSFSEVPSMPEKISTNSELIVERNMKWKNSENEKNNVTNEIKGIEKLEKENNCSSNSSKVVMMVVMEKTGEVNVEELSPIINSSLKKLESIVAQSSLDHVQVQQNKENNGLTIVSVDSYTRMSSVECYEASEPLSKLQKSQQSVKSSSGGIFAAVANVVKNAIKNLSGVAMSKNSLTNSINSSPSASILQSPIQHSTPIIQNDPFSMQESRSCKRPREEHALSDKLDFENANALNIVRSPLQKKARRWYRGIHGRQPIDRMKDYPRGISCETQRYQQGAFTVKNTILPLPARAFQVDRSTQTDF